MKTLRALLVTMVALALAATTAYGVGWAVREDPSVRGTDPTSQQDGPTRPATEDRAPTAQPTVDAPTVRQGPVLERGDRGVQVRELQSRLFQLDWFPELTTGSYDAATVEAVRGFQDRRGFEATGAVDLRTWERLVSMTDRPTQDQLFNVLEPGPALLAAGDSGARVRDVQARLVQIAWLFGDVTGSYDDATVEAVRGFQDKRAIPVTGEVDQRTLDRLLEMTRQPTHEELHNIEPEPGALDPRCTTGRVMCVDKTTNTLRWVVDGKVQSTFDVRFGSDEMPTREGAFSVSYKSRDHVSSLYDTSMPFAMFFSGGQAVHYSPDFAANGYNGASHGCVNVRDYDGIAALFDQVQVGDDVVVYWS
jgi:peptidoglycan hydrolase-like protein with peptidoglycan-binding domain